MGITIERSVLSQAMKSAATIIENANTIPILANVRLHAQGDRLEIVTSNLDIEYRQQVPLAEGGELFTTVNARKLGGLAAASEDGAQIKLEPGQGNLVAKSGRSRWVLPTLRPDDFPALPFEISRSSVEIGGKYLAGVIARTGWSASSEQVRHYLCGIYLDPEGGKIRFTTTNGHTFASVTSDIPWPADAPVAIIPSKFARTVQSVVADVETVSVVWDDAKIRVVAGPVVLTGKLVSGTFPDYRRLIPTDASRPVLVDPDSLRRALRRVELVGGDKTRGIILDIQGGALEIHMADGGGGGEASEHVPADCEVTHRTGFNAGYLVSALEAIGGDTIEIHQNDPQAVAMIRRAVPDGAICVLGAMKI